MKPTEYRHETPVQIRFRDFDALAHVNNSNYLTYLEIARTDYFQEVMQGTIDWSEDGMILANASVNFRKPILLGECITVFTRCTRFGSKSFEMAYQICRVNKDGSYTLMADATTVLVCFNYKTNSTAVVKEEWKQMIREYEPAEIA